MTSPHNIILQHSGQTIDKHTLRIIGEEIGINYVLCYVAFYYCSLAIFKRIIALFITSFISNAKSSAI